MLGSLWTVPVYLPYLHPPLRAEDVAAAEQQLGVRLPEAYLALLREQNGGYIRAELDDDTVPLSMIRGIGSHFPSITDHHEVLDPEFAITGAWVPPHAGRLVPFDGDGHWYLCLDYRERPEPTVTLVDLELEQERLVAPSFEALLLALKPTGPKACVGITEARSLEQLASMLGDALQVAFEDQGDYWYGYPVARARLGSPSDRWWAWLSPNQVPRGFVRRDDRRYAELVGLLPGVTLRVPEHPEVTHFLDYSEECATQVRSAVKALGLVHRTFD